MFDLAFVSKMIDQHLRPIQQNQVKTLDMWEKQLKALEDINLALRDLITLKKHELDPMK